MSILISRVQYVLNARRRLVELRHVFTRINKVFMFPYMHKVVIQNLRAVVILLQTRCREHRQAWVFT